MSVRDYSPSQSSRLRKYNHSRSTDRIDISSRRRLRLQDQTDLRPEAAVESQPAPAPEKANGSAEDAEAEDDLRRCQLQQLFPPSAPCYETENRLAPSVSSF